VGGKARGEPPVTKPWLPQRLGGGRIHSEQRDPVSPSPSVACVPKGVLGGASKGLRVAKYKVNIGIDTPSSRIEAGTVVEHTQLPMKSIKWLADQGIIEAIGKEAVIETPVEDAVEEVAETEETE
jgi:hypothetical protein